MRSLSTRSMRVSCVDGSIVHDGPTSPRHKKSKERLRQLVFYSVDGHEMVVVELGDKEVEYRGDFPVDAQAKAFFVVVGQLYHGCFVKPQIKQVDASRRRCNSLPVMKPQQELLHLR